MSKDFITVKRLNEISGLPASTNMNFVTKDACVTAGADPDLLSGYNRYDFVAEDDVRKKLSTRLLYDGTNDVFDVGNLLMRSGSFGTPNASGTLFTTYETGIYCGQMVGITTEVSNFKLAVAATVVKIDEATNLGNIASFPIMAGGTIVAWFHICVTPYNSSLDNWIWKITQAVDIDSPTLEAGNLFPVPKIAEGLVIIEGRNGILQANCNGSNSNADTQISKGTVLYNIGPAYSTIGGFGNTGPIMSVRLFEIRA